MATKQYDPGQVSLSWNGILISGYMDGTFIEVSRYEQSNTLKVGADGEAVKIKNRNKSGSIKFTLMQNAAANDLLSAALALDELEPVTTPAVNSATGAAQLKDNNGTTLVQAPDAWLQGWTKVSYGKEIEGREWTLDAGKLAIFAGGNS